MSKEYDHVMGTHPVYDKHIKRYRYLYQSYMGGEAYKYGEHLTKYINESEAEYEERVAVTPLDNHCKGVVSIYNSFLFKNPPVRNLANLSDNPSVQAMIKDADLEGRNLNTFMKDIATYSAIFGHAYILVSKPQSNSRTRADELAQGIRPYVSVITPMSMLDWHWQRQPSGYYTLDRIKYIEDSDGDTMIIKEWTPEEIRTYETNTNMRELRQIDVEPNGIGFVPVIPVYHQRSPKRGMGLSAIDDISDLQRAIYNEYSEVEQNIRLSNAPSLVKTDTTEAGAGPGAIISIDDTLDPGLKPYLLQPTGASIESLYLSIQNKVDAIDRIAHLGAMRTRESRRMSGVALDAEFAQLNSKLAEIADNLEIAEETLWRYVAIYEGARFEGEIEYPDNFNVRDNSMDLDFYLRATTAPVNSPTYRKELESLIAHTVVGDDAEAIAQIDAEIASTDDFVPHIMHDPETGKSALASTAQEHEDLAAQGYVH